MPPAKREGFLLISEGQISIAHIYKLKKGGIL